MQTDLDDPVNRTCRGVAAFRAVELLKHPCPILRDELSVHLAGPDAVERISKRWAESLEQCGCKLNAEPPHNYFAARARIIDDQVSAALQQLHSASDTASIAGSSNTDQPVYDEQQQYQQGHVQQGHIGLQVVSVGCGVDTRPWRLQFPFGVAWYDIDQEPVIKLKEKLLAEAAAQIEHPHLQEQQQQQPHNTASHQQQQQTSTDTTPTFPLRCSHYVAVSADITDDSWLGKLAAAGFNTNLPTVWIVEGLLYYLTPAQGQQLMQDIASSCGTIGHSITIATHIPLCNLQANQTAPPGPISGLFKSCVDDLVNGQLQSNLGSVTVLPDVFVLLREQYKAEAVYPYALEYSGGVPLKEIECTVILKCKSYGKHT